ncbi:MAG: sugar/nucleoside kinase (ribokinase family) [Gammaproteobacteria bacterium]|jgi:sugar/nucleoside kinase (ribokinase family)
MTFQVMLVIYPFENYNFVENMKNYDVYAIGNALVDIEYHASNEKLTELDIEKGVMTLIDEDQQNSLINHLGDSHERMACGGSAANTIIAMAQLGAKTHFDCRVANDITGQFFASDLHQSGVDSNLILDQKHTGVTGKCLVFVTPDADRTMNTFLGASAELSPADIDEDAIKHSDFVYIEGYLVTADCTRQAAISAMKLARRYHKKTALTLSDPNMVIFFREGMLEMIGDGVDLLFANEEEAYELAQTKDLEDAIEVIKGLASTFAITRGKDGAILFDGENIIEISGHTVAAIDTLGAGDLFAGAFMYGLSQGMNFKQSGDLASLASSKIVTQYGPRLEASETKAILAKFNAGI